MSSQPVESLKNLGPASTRWLKEIDIHTREDLEGLGPVMRYKILKHRFPGVNLLMLYALYGALHDVHWNSLSPETKAALRREAETPFGTDL